MRIWRNILASRLPTRRRDKPPYAVRIRLSRERRMEAFIGTIMPVAFDFAPRGWMKCEGQEIKISENNALFSLIGNRYGGDGIKIFKLPDLRGRMPVGAYKAPENAPPGIDLGQQVGHASVNKELTGSSSVTLDLAHLPKHSHTATLPASNFTAISTLHVSNQGPGTSAPVAGCAFGASDARGSGEANIYVTGKPMEVEMNGATVTTRLTGDAFFTTNETGSTPSPLAVPFSVPLALDMMPPALGINWIICVWGIYPAPT